MKETFDRHQEKLTAAERHGIWRKISGSPARVSRTRLRWGFSASTAILVGAVITFAVLQRDPAPPPQPDPGAGRPGTEKDEAQAVKPIVVPWAAMHAPDPADLEKAPSAADAPAAEEPHLEFPRVSLKNRDKGELALDEMVVTSERPIDTKTSTTKQQVSGDPWDSEYGNALSGLVGQSAPPLIPITGGTALPNDEPYDAMFFRNYGVNPFITTDEDSLSTFAVDVDAASYTITRRYIELGNRPPADAVRVEEFVNFFPQGYPEFENEDFRILIDGAPSPFGKGYHLLRIGLKGREISQRNRKPAQLTFVIDISGSMNREDRLGLVKRALRLLVDQLRAEDRIGIVVYGSQGRVLLEPTALGESTGRRRILEAIDRVQAGGSTNAEEGLLLAYEMARREFRSDGINRIILCSDGVANVGRTGPESILNQVRREADRGIYLSTIGFGMSNYNDVLMEQLANDADGNYYYVDQLDEARRVFVENLAGTLETIAKDAKIQVEFHSSRVLRYRLLGFENRDVADRDFRNDKVDAGEIGAGHEVTALYEIKLADQKGDEPIATVRFRYARPQHEGSGAPEVKEIAKEFPFASLTSRFEDASPHFRLDAAVAEFAEILRGSFWARENRLSDVLPVARSAARDLRTEVANEFVLLLEKTPQLKTTRE